MTNKYQKQNIHIIKSSLLILLLLLVSLLFACKDDPTLEFTKTSYIMKKGEKLNLEPKCSITDAVIVYEIDSSSDNDVIKVENNTVEALNSGTAKVIATIEGYKKPKVEIEFTISSTLDITNPDEKIMILNDKVSENKISITREKYYRLLKKDSGINALLKLIDTSILKNLKVNNVSFYDSITDTQITSEMKKAMYGKEISEEDEALESNIALKNNFLQQFYLMYGYEEEEIKEYYRLNLALAAYANSKLIDDTLTQNIYNSILEEMRRENGFEIYDYNLQYEYLKDFPSSQSIISKTSNELIAKTNYLEITPDMFFTEMDKNSGMNAITNEILITYILHNQKANPYYDYNSGVWTNDDVKKEINDQIEIMKRNFSNNLYKSYGFSCDQMSFDDFVYYGLSCLDEDDLRDVYLYNKVYEELRNELFSEFSYDIDSYTFEKSYEEMKNSSLWKVINKNQNKVFDDYFDCKGIHFLVALTNNTSYLNPETWTEEQKNIAIDLISKVAKYLENYKDEAFIKLTKICDLYEKAPKVEKVNGEYPVTKDESGNVLSNYYIDGDFTLDLTYYRNLGYALIAQDLQEFTNGQMVENFNDAVNEIWKNDLNNEKRITICEKPIQTEFGYHLYCNLESIYIFSLQGHDYDNEGNLIETEGFFPSLYEIRCYYEYSSLKNINQDTLDESKKEEINTKISELQAVLDLKKLNSINNFYSPIYNQLYDKYFFYVICNSYMIDLMNEGLSVNNTSFDLNDLSKYYEEYNDYIYTNTITYLEKNDHLAFDISYLFIGE